jgi:thymidylate kinase
MSSSPTRSRRTIIITFSGIDGAGKSTQIEAFQEYLQKSGIRATLHSFWDDVVAFARVREFASRRVFKGDAGVGSPEKPISRRDKNVRSWYAIAARIFLYLFDALSLRRTLAKISKEDAGIVILDRYIYDELANLPLHSRLIRLYLKTILKLTPMPNVAFLIDAHPEAARLRKPEYPLEFLRENRNAYLALSRLVPAMIVIEPLSIEEARARVQQAFSNALACVVPAKMNTLVLARDEMCPPLEDPQ